MQKVNFVTHLYPEKLQRYYMLVILSTLGMHGDVDQLW